MRLLVALVLFLALAATKAHKCCTCKQAYVVMHGTIAEYRALDPTFMSSAGMKDGRVADEDITASSSLDAYHGPQYGRLDNQKSFSYPSQCGSWSAKHAKAGEWLQVNLRKHTEIHGVVTQGRARNDAEQWVTMYEMSFSDDGKTFHPVADHHGETTIFPGNRDRYTSVVNRFEMPVTAQYFRLIVKTFHGWPTLRMDLLTI